MTGAEISNRTAALFCTLMRATFHGEIISARDAFVRSLASDGLTAHSVALVPATKMPFGNLSCQPPSPAFDLARACRDLDRGILSPRERAFVGEMVRRGRLSPTPKQARWLRDIYTKIQDELAA